MLAKRISISLVFLSVILANARPLGAESDVPEFKVTATVFPVADLVRQVAGPEIEVVTLVPSGANPHMFSLSPQDLKAIAGSRLLFRIGGHFDEWMSDAGESIANIKTVAFVDELKLPESRHDDPHFWLSVLYAKRMVRVIARVFEDYDPEHAGGYQSRTEAYLRKLDLLEAQIQALLGDIPQHKMVTFHDAWQYFADDFSLTIAAVVEKEGSEPTPRHMVDLFRTVKENDIRVLFAEVGTPESAVRIFREDLGLNIFWLDSLGGVPGRSNYLQLLLYNAETVRKGLLYE